MSSDDESYDWHSVNAQVLKRGEKDHAPDGTALQINTLEQSRNAMYNALSYDPPVNMKTTVECDLQPNGKLASIRKLKGNFFNTMGFVSNGISYLNSEELIYLCQRGSCICYLNNEKLKLEEVMRLCLPNIGNDNMLVYANLRRLGYTVLRSRQFKINMEPTRMLFPNIRDTYNSILFTFFNSRITSMLPKRTYFSYHSIYRDLQVVKHSPTKTTLNQKFTFDVWKPSTKFKKSNPPFPDFRVCVCNANEEMPSLSEIEEVFEGVEPKISKKNSVVTRIREGRKRFVYAVVDNGVIGYVNAVESIFESI